MTDRVAIEIALEGGGKLTADLNQIREALAGIAVQSKKTGDSLDVSGGLKASIARAGEFALGLLGVASAAEIASKAVEGIREGIRTADIIVDLHATIDALSSTAEEGEKAFDRLIKASESTRATGLQLVELYDNILPAAMRRGLSDEQAQALATQLAKAAPALGMSIERAFGDMQQILQGRISRMNLLGTILGLDQAKFMAGLQGLDAIFPKLNQIAAAGDKVQMSWAATGAKIKDELARAFAEGLQLAEGSANTGLRAIQAALTDPELLNAIKVIGKAFGDLVPLVIEPLGRIAKGFAAVVAGVDDFVGAIKKAYAGAEPPQGLADRMMEALFPNVLKDAARMQGSVGRAVGTSADETGDLPMPPGWEEKMAANVTGKVNPAAILEGIKSKLEPFGLNYRDQLRKQILDLMQGFEGMDLGKLFSDAFKLDPTRPEFHVAQEMAGQLANLAAKARELKIPLSDLPPNFEAAGKAGDRLIRTLSLMGEQTRKEAFGLMDSLAGMDPTALFAKLGGMAPDNPAGKMISGLADQFVNLKGKTDAEGVSAARLPAHFNAIAVAAQSGAAAAAAFAKRMEDAKTQGDEVAKQDPGQLIRDMEKQAQIFVNQATLMKGMGLDERDVFALIGQAALDFGDKIDALSPGMQKLAAQSGLSAEGLRNLLVQMKAQKTVGEWKKSLEDAGKVLTDLGVEQDALINKIKAQGAVFGLGDTVSVQRNAAEIRTLIDKLIAAGVTIRPDLLAFVAQLADITKSASEIAAQFAAATSGILQQTGQSFLGDILKTGGKNFGQIAGDSFNQITQEGGKALSEYLKGALGEMFSPGVKQVGGKFFVGTRQFDKQSEAEAFAGTAFAKETSGQAALNAITAVTSGFVQGFTSPKTQSDLENAVGAAVNGLMAGISTGSWIVGIAVAVAQIVGKLAQPSPGSTYPYAAFGVSAQGQAQFSPTQNIPSNKAKEALAAVQKTYDDFWDGYLNIIMKLPLDFPKVLAGLTKTITATMGDVDFGADIGKAASAHFWEEFQSWLAEGMPREVGGKFFGDMQKGFEALGMSAEKFTETWLKLSNIDPKQAMQDWSDLADALKQFQDASAFFAIGATGLLRKQEADDTKTFAQTLKEADKNIVSLAEAMSAMTGEGQIQAAKELGNLLQDRMQKEQQFLRDVNTALDAIAQSFKATIGQWTMEGMKLSTGAPDIGAQIKYMRDQLQDLIAQMVAATSPQQVQGLSQSILSMIGNIKTLGGQLGPEAAEAMRKWAIAEANVVQQQADDRLHALAKEMEDTNQQLIDAIKGFIDAFNTATEGLVGMLWNVSGGTPAGTMPGDKVTGNVGCFVAGTPVLMADGSMKPIEDVELGDLVLARSEATGETGAKRVVHLFIHDVGATLLLRLANGEEIETTREHRFFQWDGCVGAGFVAAGELQAGAELGTAATTRARLNTATRRETGARVYNFEVEDFHTYFVGASRLWVHNLKAVPAPHDGGDPYGGSRNPFGVEGPESAFGTPLGGYVPEVRGHGMREAPQPPEPRGDPDMATRRGPTRVVAGQTPSPDALMKALEDAILKATKAIGDSIKDTMKFFATPVLGAGTNGRGLGLLDQVRAEDEAAKSFFAQMRQTDQQITLLAGSLGGLVGQDKLDAAAELNQLLADKMAKEKAFLQEINQAIDSIDQNFTKQISEWKMEGLKNPDGSPDVQAQAKYLRDETEQLRLQMMASTDPAKVQQLSDEILQNIGRIKDLGGQLGPEAAEAYRKWAIEQAEKVQQQATDHLKALGQQLQDANKSFVAAINNFVKALDEATGRISKPRQVPDVGTGGAATPTGRGRTGTVVVAPAEGNDVVEPGAPSDMTTALEAALDAMRKTMQPDQQETAATLKALAEAIAGGQLIKIELSDHNVNISVNGTPTGNGDRAAIGARVIRGRTGG